MVINSSDPLQILEAYTEAVYARDVQAMLTLYHPQVTMYDMWETWLYDGRDAWRGMVEAGSPAWVTSACRAPSRECTPT